MRIKTDNILIWALLLIVLLLQITFFYNCKVNIRNLEIYNLKIPKLFLSQGMVNGELNSFVKKNKLGIVQLVGQADIDPEDDLEINYDLLKKRIVQLFPEKNSNGICVLDWEGKGMDALKDTKSMRNEYATDRFIDALKFAQVLRPNVQWGYYGLPFREYWKRDSIWSMNCESLYPILNQSDILFPSLYLLYLDTEVPEEENEKYLQDNVISALKIGKKLAKPVLPFVWHRISSKHTTLEKGYMSEKEFLHYISQIINVDYKGERVSGIVWWGNPKYFYQVENRGKLSTRSYKYDETIYLKDLNQFIRTSSISILKELDSTRRKSEN